MPDLHKQTIAELSEKLASGECSSVDIVTDVLASIDATDAKVGAYLTLDREDALAQAKAADEKRAAGSTLPMLGIPVAIKDLLNVKGHGKCGAGKNIQSLEPRSRTRRFIRRIGRLRRGR